MRLPCLALTAVSCLPALVSATPLHGISTATQAGYATGSAEYATPTSYATKPYKQPTKTHSVIVGGLDATGAPVLRYNPESVTGYIGDVVEFLFLANNHSVTQADFNSPCFPKSGAFNSGFRPNMANVLGQVTASFTIVTESPEWFYCAQTAGAKPHCQAGMVFAVNAPQEGEKTLESFRQKAMAVPVVVAPSSSVGAPATAAAGAAAAARVTHTVTVGGLVAGNPKPVLRYNPETVIANVGDIVEFNFRAANHTATQSSFDSPCVGIPDGFKTGVQMNPYDIDRLILRQFEVVDSKPVWFYCGFSNHCEQGMVFAINPQDKFDAFKAKAIAAAPASMTTAVMATATVVARATHTVTVGGLVAGNPKPVLRYNPETVIANVGDIVEFNFRAANHTATQSSFDSPCVGIPDGFKTGVQMNPYDIDRLILKQFEVKDSKPVWFYCGFSNHCEQGMVFAVNPQDKFAAFKAKAIGA